MKTIAERRARAREEFDWEMKKLDIEEGVQAPVPPDLVFIFSPTDLPKLTYNVGTLTEALELIEKFPAPLPLTCVESGCTVIDTPYRLRPPYTDKLPRWTVDHGYAYRQHLGRGFHSKSIEFHLPDYTVEVSIATMPQHTLARIDASYGKGGHCVSANKHLPKCHFDQRVVFGGGGKDSTDVRLVYAGLESMKESLGEQK